MKTSLSQEEYETTTCLEAIFLTDSGLLHLFSSNEDFHRDLYNYCVEHNIYPHKLILRFRSHSELVFTSSDEDGLFLIRSAKCNFGSTKTEHRYIFGKVYHYIIYSNTWTTPEIIMVNNETKHIKDYSDECFIWR